MSQNNGIAFEMSLRLLSLAFLFLMPAAYAQEPVGAQPKQPAGTATETVIPAIPAPAGPNPDEPVSYDPELARLATILGSLHYLRNLCGETGNQWRDEMQTIILSDKMESLRKKRAIAAFNDGYQAFSASYTQCNPRAIEAIGKFQIEGAALTATILTRYKS
jgi:uncharacterized protein (TIGR02301 family)